MCQRALAVAAIVILVGSPSGRRASQIPAGTKSPLMPPSIPQTGTKIDTPETRIKPRHAQLEDSATYVGDSYNTIRDKILYSLTNGESMEEQQGYNYNSYYAPSTVNFHDIYSNSLAMLAEEPVLTTVKDIPQDDSYHLNNIPTQFVEFHPQTQTIPPITSPPPMFLLNSSFIKNESESTTTSSTSTTTEEPEEININVIPIKKEYQRGVLDLLFPAARVRTFKSVFDTFRRLMSHTFR